MTVDYGKMGGESGLAMRKLGQCTHTRVAARGIFDAIIIAHRFVGKLHSKEALGLTLLGGNAALVALWRDAGYYA